MKTVEIATPNLDPTIKTNTFIFTKITSTQSLKLFWSAPISK
jgi:hypothetical protein